MPFHRNRVVNKHNVRICGTDNPQEVEQVQMKSEKIMVWCAMLKTGIVGPNFFRQSSADSAEYKSINH